MQDDLPAFRKKALDLLAKRLRLGAGDDAAKRQPFTRRFIQAVKDRVGAGTRKKASEQSGEVEKNKDAAKWARIFSSTMCAEWYQPDRRVFYTLPLHVARFIRAAAGQRDDMVNHEAFARANRLPR